MYKTYRIKTKSIKAIPYTEGMDLESLHIYNENPQKGDMIFEAPYDEGLFLLYTKERFDSKYELLDNKYNKDPSNNYKEYRRISTLRECIPYSKDLIFKCLSCNKDFFPEEGDMLEKRNIITGEDMKGNLTLEEDHRLWKAETFKENFELEETLNCI